MATTTITLQEYIENFSHYQHYRDGRDINLYSTREKIEIGRPFLFDFDYPIFDVSYKQIFETHFIKRFYMNEIGFETMGLFKLNLDTWLNINMPYFNQLFESELIEYDPLTNTRVDTTHNKTNDQVSESTGDLTGQTSSDTSETGTLGQNVSGKTDGLVNVDYGETGLTDTTQTTNTTGNSKTDFSGESESSENTSTTVDETGEQTDDNFKRKLHEDTPDDRLAITTEDGQGVIEYASDIDEETQNNTTNTEKHSEQSGQTTTNTNSSGSEENNTQENSELNAATNSQIDGNSDTTSTETNTQTTDQDTTKDTHFTSETGQQNTQNGKVNTIEDYVENRYGKIGGKSYAQMVKEYRQSFIRIENQIFSEMRELFMIVY